jgi:hypothetical protein
MKSLKHWACWLTCVAALTVIASNVQRDARAQSFGGGSDYGLIAYAPPPKAVMLSASYVATPADCGTTFNNSGAGATLTLTLPPNPTLGCVIGVAVYNGGFGVVVQNQSGEFIQVAGTSTASSGNITYAAGLGSTIRLEKQLSNRWFTTANEGAAPTIN